MEQVIRVLKDTDNLFQGTSQVSRSHFVSDAKRK